MKNIMKTFFRNKIEKKTMLNFAEEVSDNEPEVRFIDLSLKDLLKYETDSAFKIRQDLEYHELRGKGLSHEEAMKIVNETVIRYSPESKEGHQHDER